MVKNILIVDDESDIRELLEITLSRMDLEPFTAASLSEAKKALAEQAIDLCLIRQTSQMFLRLMDLMIMWYLEISLWPANPLPLASGLNFLKLQYPPIAMQSFPKDRYAQQEISLI